MQDSPVNLILAFALGCLSTVLVEIIRHRLENSRLKKNDILDSIQERGKSVKDFLSTIAFQPSWLKLVKTTYDPPFFQNAKTRDAKTVVNTIMANQENYQKEVTLKKYLLSRIQVIGRQKDCEIQLSDTALSRVHALVRYEENNFVLYDLGSKSGSYVNKKKVAKDGAIISNNDRIEIGDSVLIFEGATKRRTRNKSEGTTKSGLKDQFLEESNKSRKIK